MTADERIVAFHLLDCINDVAAMNEAANIRGFARRLRFGKGRASWGGCLAKDGMTGIGAVKPRLVASAHGGDLSVTAQILPVS
jgi:hypothetical protein